MLLGLVDEVVDVGVGVDEIVEEVLDEVVDVDVGVDEAITPAGQMVVYADLVVTGTADEDTEVV